MGCSRSRNSSNGSDRSSNHCPRFKLESLANNLMAYLLFGIILNYFWHNRKYLWYMCATPAAILNTCTNIDGSSLLCHCYISPGIRIFFVVYKPYGQSYKHFTFVNYDPRGIPDLKIPHITTLES